MGGAQRRELLSGHLMGSCPSVAILVTLLQPSACDSDLHGGALSNLPGAWHRETERRTPGCGLEGALRTTCVRRCRAAGGAREPVLGAGTRCRGASEGVWLRETRGSEAQLQAALWAPGLLQGEPHPPPQPFPGRHCLHSSHPQRF